MVQWTMQILLAFLAVMVVLTGCPADTEPAQESREILRLSGQVHTRETNLLGAFNNSAIEYRPFGGNVAIYDNDLGGTGSIVGGQFSYSAGKPNDASLMPVNPDEIDFSIIEDIYTNITVSRKDAHIAYLSLLPQDSADYDLLMQEYMATALAIVSANSATMRITTKIVNYMYTDQDLTITAQGSENSYLVSQLPIEIPEDLPFSLAADAAIAVTANPINLDFRKGWNAVYASVSVTIHLSMDLSNLDLSNPSLESLNITVTGVTGEVHTSLDDSSPFVWTLSSAEEISNF